MTDSKEQASKLDGIFTKSARIEPMEVTDEDMARINAQALEPLTADEVYVFKTMAADNEGDDRNYAPFTRKALDDLASLYVGKPMIKDHERTADGQVARVFDAYVVEDASKTTEIGEAHAELMLKLYMVKTASNADLIAEIKGGIKREVSTSTAPTKAVCSICGVDNINDHYCKHWGGRAYANAEGDASTCKFWLDGCKDAYEVSLVAVPAQPRAGAHKVAEATVEAPTDHHADDRLADELAVRERLNGSFTYINNERTDC